MSTPRQTEQEIGRYIAGRYRDVAEVGVGNNFEAALVIREAGVTILCTDIRDRDAPPGIRFVRDDVTRHDTELYRGKDCIYAIRPGEEMMRPLIALAEEVGADLLVYHLGFEIYADGGEIIPAGKVLLHRYVRGTKCKGVNVRENGD